MVMALAGNKADLVESRKVAAEVNIIFCFLSCLLVELYTAFDCLSQILFDLDSSRIKHFNIKIILLICLVFFLA